MPILKAGTRPGLKPVAEFLSSRLGITRAGCPVCQLSTRSHPLHSTARVQVEKQRIDHIARREFFGPGGILENAQPHQGFRKFASQRQNSESSIPLNLPSLLSTLSNLSSLSQRPTRQAYLTLLQAASDYSVSRSGSGGESLLQEEDQTPEELVNLAWRDHGETGLGWKVAWCAWRDAIQGGMDLGIEGFDLLLRAAQPHPLIINALLSELPRYPTLSSSLTTLTYSFLLNQPLATSNLERVLQLYAEMRKRDVPPPTNRTPQVIALCCEMGVPRLAIEMAEQAERGEVRGIVWHVWVDILRSSAENQYLEGTRVAWERTVVDKKFAPDEGLILLVLHVAGRFGDTDLATSAIAQLGPLLIQPQEHHLAPLLEAYCVKGMLTDAMEVLDVMRTTAGIDPNLHTAAPIVRIIGQDTGLFDSAYFALETLNSSGKTVDVSALNAVIAAAEKLGDLGRAVAVYQQAPKLGVRPNTETFNSLLGACIAKKAKPQGDLLIKEMQNPKRLPGDEVDFAPIPMDLTTYTKLIYLALTQPTYEEAFFYLEKMKDAKHRPPLEVYEALVAKCVSSGDQRFKLVLEEMRAGGYRVSKSLYANIQRYLEGRPAKGVEETDGRRWKGQGRGGKRGERAD